MAIVAMKYVLFLSHVRESEAVLRGLQDIGVLHPEHLKRATESEQLKNLEHKLHVQNTVIKSLSDRNVKNHISDSAILPSIWDVESWLSDEKKFIDGIAKVEREIEKQACLGDFDPEDVGNLSGSGVSLQLWGAPKKEFEEYAKKSEVHIHVISRHDDVCFATFSLKGPVKIPFAVEREVPKSSLSALKEELSDLRRRLESISAQIDSATVHLPSYRKKNAALTEERDFYETLGRAFEDESVSAFAGWVPADNIEHVAEMVHKSFPGVFMKARDPMEDESPPIKTKNSWLASVFEPLLHILGFPKYGGIDPALFFAPSMMLFFGICLSDAGYGAIMILIGAVAKKLLSAKIPAIRFVSNMTILLGLTTVVWGLATGSIFGIPFAQREWILVDVAPDVGDPMLLFKISIVAGVLHISIALMISIISSNNFSERMIKAGTLFVLWGGALAMIKYSIWPYIAGAGILLILTFSSDAKNPLKRLGAGIWGVYGLTGLLGDVMSYARLFGLGVASGAIASVINVLAVDVRGAVPVVGILLSIIVLLLGHSFNFAMGVMGALVHPARLHAVEAFPKCVQLSGAPYKPLEKI
ncbi:MAG: hypothetical protein GX659_00025 [Myxococcales bacterium]|nr:hypothetical protein [Myxococcales bacterium]